MGHRGTLNHLVITMGLHRYMCTWGGTYSFICILNNLVLKPYSQICIIFSKISKFDISVISVTLYIGQNCLFSFVLFALYICSVSECDFLFQMCFIQY